MPEPPRRSRAGPEAALTPTRREPPRAFRPSSADFLLRGRRGPSRARAPNRHGDLLGVVRDLGNELALRVARGVERLALGTRPLRRGRRRCAPCEGLAGALSAGELARRRGPQAHFHAAAPSARAMPVAGGARAPPGAHARESLRLARSP